MQRGFFLGIILARKFLTFMCNMNIQLPFTFWSKFAIVFLVNHFNIFPKAIKLISPTSVLFVLI